MKPKIKIDESKVIELFNKGFGERRIAAAMNCGRKPVVRAMKENNLRRASSQSVSRGKTEADFWNNLEIIKGSNCWVWKGRKDHKGYGIVRFGGVNYRTHRLSYLLSKGDITEGLFVCHKCDNPPCCNPEHLFLGTNKDNIIDALKKNRQSNCKLKTEDIQFIRNLHKMSLPVSQIAEQFKVCEQTIKNILQNRAWYYVK